MRALGVGVMSWLGNIFGGAGKAADAAVNQTVQAASGNGSNTLFNIAALGGVGFGAYKLFENWDDPTVQKTFADITDYIQGARDDPNSQFNTGLNSVNGVFNSATDTVSDNQDAIFNFLLYVMLPGFLGGSVLKSAFGSPQGITGLALSIAGAIMTVRTVDNPQRTMDFIKNGWDKLTGGSSSAPGTLASLDRSRTSTGMQPPEELEIG